MSLPELEGRGGREGEREGERERGRERERESELNAGLLWTTLTFNRYHRHVTKPCTRRKYA